MTTRELHYDFKLKFDRVASNAKPDFLDSEIDWFLNEAQNMLIKQKYMPGNKYRSGFEVIQKRIDDLKSLVVKLPDQPPLQPIAHSDSLYEIPLARLKYKYLFFISGTASLLDKSSACSSTADLKLISHDDLYKTLKDPWNKPDRKSILFNFGKSSVPTSQSSIFLYSNSSDQVESVSIDYLRQPSRISLGTYTYIDGQVYPEQTSELPEHTHNEVVDLAVYLAAQSTENPEMLPLKAQQLTINE